MNFEPALKSHFNLASRTSWLIGGPADYFFEPDNIVELQNVWSAAQQQKVPVTVLGGGTNVLISDIGVPGLTLSLKKISGIEIVKSDRELVVWAKSGTPKSELLKLFLKYKLSPAKMLAGLPGQVGGGVTMNAGISEKITPREFCEIVTAVEVLRPDGTLEIVRAASLKWSYRHSDGWQPGLITRVEITWPMITDPDLLAAVKKMNLTRMTKQPLDWPSCGSVFRNPLPDSAGALIEKAGLKGTQFGGAQISEKHANFIINTGNAKASDVDYLMNLCVETVKKKFHVELKSEVVRMGKF